MTARKDTSAERRGTLNDDYEITIRGNVSDRALAPFLDEFDVVRTGKTTTLTGQILDPSHLHGIVAHLTSRGLTIVQLTPMARSSDDLPATP